MLLSIALFVLEAKFTSHGVLGAGGALAMILGAVLLVKGPPEMRIHLATALSVAIPFALITVFLVSIAVRARANKVVTGDSGFLGAIGVARTALVAGRKGACSRRILECDIIGSHRAGRYREGYFRGRAYSSRRARGYWRLYISFIVTKR